HSTERLSEPIESAEMEIGEPCENLVAKAELVGGARIKCVDDTIERPREGKVGSRDAPHHDKEKATESEHIVQIPIDSRKARSPINRQAPAPMRDSRPPYNRSRQAKQCQRDCPDAVQAPAGISH